MPIQGVAPALSPFRRLHPSPHYTPIRKWMKMDKLYLENLASTSTSTLLLTRLTSTIAELETATSDDSSQVRRWRMSGTMHS